MVRGLAGQGGGRVGMPGDHILGLLAGFLAHQVDHGAPLLTFGRIHDVEHGDPPAGPLRPAAGISQRIAHFRALVDDDQEDPLLGPAGLLAHTHDRLPSATDAA